MNVGLSLVFSATFTQVKDLEYFFHHHKVVMGPVGLLWKCRRRKNIQLFQKEHLSWIILFSVFPRLLSVWSASLSLLVWWEEKSDFFSHFAFSHCQDMNLCDKEISGWCRISITIQSLKNERLDCCQRLKVYECIEKAILLTQHWLIACCLSNGCSI